MGRRGRQARAKTLPKQTRLTTRAFSTQADSGGCSLSRLPETRGKLTGARYTASKTRPRPPPRMHAPWNGEADAETVNRRGSRKNSRIVAVDISISTLT